MWEYIEIILVPAKREGIDSLLVLADFPNFSTISWKRAGLNFHSVAFSSTLDWLPASVLIVPGIHAAETHN